MKILGAIAGGIFLVAGVAGSGVGVFALIDPRGTKMSDDADAFGPPPSVLALVFDSLHLFARYRDRGFPFMAITPQATFIRMVARVVKLFLKTFAQ